MVKQKKQEETFNFNYERKEPEKKILLSSSSFYHLTGSLDTLLSIIKVGFRPLYSTEQFKRTLFGNTSEFYVDIPMVSFSNLPLSLLKDNLEAYGKYGFGMSLDWIKKNGVSPVRYIDIDSSEYLSWDESLSMYEEAKHEIEQLNLTDSNITKYVLHTFKEAVRKIQLIKPYEADLIRAKEETILTNYNFYNEREWRYVPSWELTQAKGLDSVIPLHPYDQYEIKKFRSDGVLKGDQLNIKFDIDTDLRYIIISKKKDVAELFQRLSKMDSKVNWDEKLRGKLIVMENASKDF